MRLHKELFSSLLLLATASLATNEVEAQATTRRIATGFSNPTWAGAPEGDPRIFIALKGGRIRILQNGVLQPGTFLNINAQVSNGSEQGLLGVAFAPDYATSGHFFVNYTNTNGTTVISRFTVDATDPNLADPTSEEIVLTIPQPFSNHNAGDIHFGPDGFLYISTGDGGSGNDPGCVAQDLSSLLGKMLRIDVSTLPYSIPPTNPFIGVPGAQPEIIHFGLRNPWRFTIDFPTGDLIIGDVGQNSREEISAAPGGNMPFNFGWKIMEANRCNQSLGCQPNVPPCFDASFEDPIIELPQSGGSFTIIGGHVYRGSLLPGEFGKYFFADFFDDRIRSVDYDGATGNVSNLVDRTAELDPPIGAIRNIAAFGVDGFGELLIIDHTASGNGEVFKLVPASAAEADAVIEYGLGINPQGYTPESLPILGNVYQADVDVSAHPGGASATALLGFSGSNNITLPFGELFISGSAVFLFSQASTGAVDAFSNAIPLNIALNGATVYSQAFSAGAGNMVAYNGVTLTVGMF